MKFARPNYNEELYNSSQLKRLAKKTAVRILEELELRDAETVVVTGKSGIAMGFAALCFADFNLVTVRKDAETSHGGPVEGRLRQPENERYIILDDFIDTGATIERIIKKMEIGYKEDEPKPKCVGVLKYACTDKSKSFQGITLLRV